MQGASFATATLPKPKPRRVASERLLAPAGELVIVHNGREYRLRVTLKGKLILTA
jgi:hemin uptake protein HemP